MLRTGDHDYKAYVGPPGRYDLMGATQFGLLYSLGLRSSHRLLDIGCGSLRAGRFLITYLDAGNYTGLDPNKWLIDEAIEKEIGRDILAINSPTFIYNDQFDVSGLSVFDFVVAQSIASHTGPTLTKSLLRSLHDALAPDGIAAITFVHAMGSENRDEGWVYPGVVRYRKSTIKGWLHEAGLKGSPIAWFHPDQTWWLVVKQSASLPPRAFRRRSLGVTLAHRASWNRTVRLGRRLVRLKRSRSEPGPLTTERDRLATGPE